jgi:hypothetical protein
MSKAGERHKQHDLKEDKGCNHNSVIFFSRKTKYNWMNSEREEEDVINVDLL